MEETPARTPKPSYLTSLDGLSIEVVITSFGDRPHAVELVRRMQLLLPGVPVSILSEKNMETTRNGHPRWGVHNSNIAKAEAVLKRDDGLLLILDDDMIPVNKAGILNGLVLAKRFGLCLPANPRHYAGINAGVGADMDGPLRGDFADLVPFFMTGINMGVVFANCVVSSVRELFRRYELRLLRGPMRGTSAMDWTIWESGIQPHILSERYCVCGDNARHVYTAHGRILVPPVFLHCGHQKVKEWFETDSYFEEHRHVRT